MRKSLNVIWSCLFLSIGFLVAGEVAEAQNHSKYETFLSAKEAGQSFEIQGEYSGSKDEDGFEEKLGVQVIALGNDQFHAVGYPGGLPGDGWDGEKVEADGKLHDGKVEFREGEYAGIWSDGVIKIYAGDQLLGTLEKVVRKSPTLGAKPPEGATVLFDGTSAENFQNGRLSEDHLLKQGCVSKQEFGDYTLHLEFLLSYMPDARGQARANSGMYVNGRYEVQVLDSFGLTGEWNECGGIYKVARPNVNMCFPPLSWQTYDVDFTAPRFDEDGKKVKNAVITVRHNGVVIHDNLELPDVTAGGKFKTEGPTGPLYLQDHRDEIRFRNIWVAEK
ncbi:3-keto-disaccharide hydrolase [Calycomorphotria hydatis]|uniref:3-keto-alpha-glucoside-1,2-lyase/3-keto-2-hydroxy-glucal hydratase domain-containing protein n=1 Tax=Calycomorphotria hydatis TaxID=2528027 RepID=A0A517T583_9PLAN|nr:DUF1080 domain-containing protein [Calycomorphotria hydatis]QDT63528.1 hypothetical protein V22_07500 [Calycomorphotria hydatis]